MSRSIAICGAGPGLGQAVAHRYAREGYEVVLIACGRQRLDTLANALVAVGATVHVTTADLSDLDAVPAADLTPQRAKASMPLAFYSLLPLVHEFLPHMLEQGDGAILSAQGAGTVHGLPGMSGPGPAQAAQRNCLQSLSAEVADKGDMSGCSISVRSSRTAPSTLTSKSPKPLALGGTGGQRYTRRTSPTFSGRCIARRASQN
jgi:short-subunit dehydrogenase